MGCVDENHFQNIFEVLLGFTLLLWGVFLIEGGVLIVGEVA